LLQDSYLEDMAKRKITIETRAGMIQRGFGEMAKKRDMDRRFNSVVKRFDAIDDRFDRIEKPILADHKRRIERLEDQVKDLRDLLAIK
jgi:archaellum component FlaC